MTAEPAPWDPALVAAARGLKLVLFDVDGVLTDGALYYSERGEAMKAFNSRDGHGLVLLRDHVKLGVISGRPGLARARLEDLRFEHLLFAKRDKLAAYEELAHLGYADAEVAFMGDDVVDVRLLRRVGLPCAPADAHPEVLRAARFVSRAPGGRGAVRELCELILHAKGVPLY